MTYVYQCPTEQGARRVELSKAAHNRLFKHDQRNWTKRFEYYLYSNRLYIQRFNSYPVIAIGLITMPIAVFWHGISNAIKEVPDEIRHTFNPKKYGSFTSDTIWLKSNIWPEIMSEIEIEIK